MSNQMDLGQIFQWYAEQFEATTTRGESDTVMRNFLSVILTFVGTRQNNIEGISLNAMREMSRIITAWERFREE